MSVVRRASAPTKPAVRPGGGPTSHERSFRAEFARLLAGRSGVGPGRARAAETTRRADPVARPPRDPRSAAAPPEPLAPDRRRLPLPADEEVDAPPGQPAQAADLLDPLARGLAVAPPPADALASPRPVFADWAHQVIRRLVWGGAGRRGAARIELADGALAGAIEVRTDGAEVEVHIEDPSGALDHAIEQRLVRRLEARGLRVSVRIS